MTFLSVLLKSRIHGYISDIDDFHKNISYIGFLYAWTETLVHYIWEQVGSMSP